MMNTLAEEKLVYIYGGTENPVNGWGGGSFIKVGDKVTWNEHSELGTGTVDAIAVGFAIVTFRTLFGLKDYVVDVTELNPVQ